MLIFEGIDELTEFFIICITLVVLYLAWRTTYVHENRSPQAVLVIENNLRRQHPVTINILRSPSEQSNGSNATETEDLDIEENDSSITQSIDNITQSILSEAVLNDEQFEGPEEILREMDRDIENEEAFIRQRRPPIFHQTEVNNEQPSGPSKQIRIKLKYLNDDLKLVEGDLNEVIGDFKKRNFTLELAAQKIIRLVFNGHVLQPDSKTLAACGLFDNCVVHCLIHSPKANTGGNNNDSQSNETNSPGMSEGSGSTNNNEQENRDNINRYGTYIIYSGTFVMSLVIIFCWFCRFQYSYLFNLNGTIGLILTTTIFLIMMPSIILIENNTRED